MRRLALLAAALLATGGCSTSPCQQLGEKLCLCTGLGADSCQLQVQNQLNSIAVDDETCDAKLNTCNDARPAEADFCSWLQTESGKRSCGLAPVAP